MSLVLCTREEESRSLAHGILMVTPDQADDYLMHWRTKGSKNGIRLYQYKDGSLTPLGYIHYGVGQSNRNGRKAEEYAKKAQKAQEEYERASVKSAKAQDKSEKKQTQKNADKAAAAFKKQNDAKMKMDEYRNQAEIYNSRVKQQEEERQRKLESDTKGMDQDSANRLREAVGNRLKSGKNTDSMLKEMDEKKASMDEHKFQRNFSRFDKLSAHDQRTVGDEVLKRVHDFDSDSNSEIDSKEANKLRDWMFDRINSKSGNWNVGESVSKNNKEAMDKMYEASEKVTDRLIQIKKDIDYVDKSRDEREHPFMSLFTSQEYYNKEAERLKKALRDDKTYKALDEAYKQSEKDLCGAVLKDIGFSDTPENRSLIYPYVFLD